MSLLAVWLWLDRGHPVQSMGTGAVDHVWASRGQHRGRRLASVHGPRNYSAVMWAGVEHPPIRRQDVPAPKRLPTSADGGLVPTSTALMMTT